VASNNTGSSVNWSSHIFGRKTTSNGTHVSLRIVWSNGSGNHYIGLAWTSTDTTTDATTETAKTFADNTDYEAVFSYVGTAYKGMLYSAGTFPPGSDYKTPTWDFNATNASPTTQSGKAGYGCSRVDASSRVGEFADVQAHASGESATAPTLGLTVGNTLLTVAVTEPSADQKRAALWYFLRYKASSQPTNETDGTLVTGAGTGLSGSAIRSDGRYLDDPADFNITGLSNGTTYYVRPFVVMDDGTIVAGTAVSATPSGGDVTPPNAPLDFAAGYASPFVASRIDLAWTNPSEAGTYKINYRTDGTYPTSDVDGSATTLVAYTSYSSSTAGSASATSLTDGTRYSYAIWHKDSSGNISSGAFADHVAVHLITLDTPADGATGVQTGPYLEWQTNAGEQENGRPVHYRVEVSTSEVTEVAFVAGTVLDVSSMTTGSLGFEYESSPGAWTGLPTTGLAEADIGKNVRYLAAELTDTGQFFWRVRAQQPGS
jgi:hypothetical protein